MALVAEVSFLSAENQELVALLMVLTMFSDKTVVGYPGS